MTILYRILLTGTTTTCPWRPWPVWEPPRCPSEVAFSKRAAEIVTLFPFSKFLLISLLSQLCSRSGPSMEGPIIWKAVMACLSWIYNCWFQGNGGPTGTSRNSRKWEGRGGGFWATEWSFPIGILEALCCHCFYRGKWCSGQCSLYPTGEPRLDRKWRRSVTGGKIFALAHLVIGAVLNLKCPFNKKSDYGEIKVVKSKGFCTMNIWIFCLSQGQRCTGWFSHPWLYCLFFDFLVL